MVDPNGALEINCLRKKNPNGAMELLD